MSSGSGQTIRSSIFTGAAGLTLVGLFAPWLRSGTSTRSSFELLDIVERLGFSPDGVFGWAARAWPIVPLLVVGAVVACWAHRPTWAAAVGGVAGCYVCAVSVGVANAPEAGLIRTGWGVTASLVGGLALVAAASWVAVASRSA